MVVYDDMVKYRTTNRPDRARGDVGERASTSHRAFNNNLLIYDTAQTIFAIDHRVWRTEFSACLVNYAIRHNVLVGLCR